MEHVFKNSVCGGSKSLKLHIFISLFVTVASGSLLFGGCGTGEDTTTVPRPEMPQTVKYNTVRLEYGEDDGIRRDRSGLRRQRMIGDESEVAELARETVFGTNRALYAAFELIENVRQSDPERPSQRRWIWQRDGDPAVRLEFFQRESGRFQHQLSVGDGLDSLSKVVEGYFTDLTSEQSTQNGEGLLRFDFDKLSEAGVTDYKGKARISFRREGGVKQVRVTFINFSGGFVKEPLKTRNEYVSLPNGNTRFRFFGRTDIFDADPSGVQGQGQGGGQGAGNEGKKELLQIEAAWRPQRQGKAAVEAKGASVERPRQIDLCWNQSQKLVWATSQPEVSGYSGGDKSKCSEQIQQLDLEPPQVVRPPEGDPDVPEPHPSETSS